MKASSGLFAVLFILWSGASTYWYVCKIKKDCDKQKTEIAIDIVQTDKTQTFATDTVSIIKDTVSVINNLKEKLTKGYSLYNFPKNSAVNSQIDTNFDEFADNLKIYFEKTTSDKILITGYTDNTGTPQANIFVGKKRAEFLKTKLIEKGIDKNKIKTASEGQNNPVAENNTEEGRTKNRRAVITIIHQ